MTTQVSPTICFSFSSISYDDLSNMYDKLYEKIVKLQKKNNLLKDMMNVGEELDVLKHEYNKLNDKTENLSEDNEYLMLKNEKLNDENEKLSKNNEELIMEFIMLKKENENVERKMLLNVVILLERAKRT